MDPAVKDYGRSQAEGAYDECVSSSRGGLADRPGTISGPVLAELRGEAHRRADLGDYVGALSLISRSLEPPHCIGWSSLCVRESLASDVSESTRRGLALCQSWLADRDERLRLRAARMAAELPKGTPMHALMLAIAWTGGSVAAVGERLVPPPRHLTSRMATSAVLLSAAIEHRRTPTDAYRDYIDRGLQFAEATVPKHPATQAT